MKPKITLILQLENGASIEVQRELDEWILKEVFTPLDHAKPNSYGSRIHCTDPITVERVMNNRKLVAKVLSKELARALIELLGRQDTVMGYRSGI